MNEAHGPVKLDKSSSDPDAIRGREQINIINIRRTKSEGGSSENAINSIGKHYKKIKEYMEAGKKL